MDCYCIRKHGDGVCRGVAPGVRVRYADPSLRTVEFVASDESVDGSKTVLPVTKWDLRRYEKNPVVSYQHLAYSGSDPDTVIGKGRAYVEGGQLRVTITFETEDINPTADKIFRKILFGSLNAVSVGFRPTADGHFGRKDHGEDPSVFYYDGQELLEISVVNIPSNANAVKVPDGMPEGDITPHTTGGSRSTRSLTEARAKAAEMLASTPGTPEHAIASAKRVLRKER